MGTLYSPQAWLQKLKNLLLFFVIVVPMAIWVFVSQFPVEAGLLGQKLETLLSEALDFLIRTTFLENPTLVLFGITIPIFVLTVTFLGRAAKVAQEQQEIEEAKNKREYDENIKELKEKLNASPDNTRELQETVRTLTLKRRFFENQTAAIKKKYKALGLQDAVLFPSSGFLLSLLFQKLLLDAQQFWYQLTFALLALIALAYGLRKILVTLLVVQEISLRADDDEKKELHIAIAQAIRIEQEKGTAIPTQLAETLTATLKALDQQKQPHPIIKFLKQQPPFVFKMNTEDKIEFSIDLMETGGKEANHVEVLFITSTEIEILKHPQYACFHQRMDYSIPGANSAIFRFAKVKKHTYQSGFLKIKGIKPGTFRLRYKVECDGYVEKSTEVGILIQE